MHIDGHEVAALWSRAIELAWQNKEPEPIVFARLIVDSIRHHWEGGQLDLWNTCATCGAALDGAVEEGHD